MRHLISLKEQTKEGLLTILELAQKIKAKRTAGELTNYLSNQTLVMLFQKSSTRTRLSFEAGMTELGGHAIFVDQRSTQFSMTDFKLEIAAVMRFGQALMFRANKAKDVELAASFNQIPVIDACSEQYHPAQALGDIFTMAEVAGGVDKIKKIAWLGIENNVSNTLKLASSKLGIKIAIAAPEANPASVDQELNKLANATGLVAYTTSLEEALSDADFVHTDTWMDIEYFKDGKVKPEFKIKYEERKEKFMPFQLNIKLINKYCPEAKIMHCMPCHIGYEITQDVVDHPNSILLGQAENRLHAQKGMLVWLLNKEELVK